MLDQKVTDALILHDVTEACEDPTDLVYLAHPDFISTKGQVYHSRCTRKEAEDLIQRFPDKYRLADGPDGIDRESEPWSFFDDSGDIIDTNGELDDPAERLTDEDRERIRAYRAETTEAERRAIRQKWFDRAHQPD